VFNMLNAKYFIVSENEVQQNPEANGNAWFVRDLMIAKNANEEILALSNLKTKSEVVIRENEIDNNFVLNNSTPIDSLASIKLSKYAINELVYESESKQNEFAVFSEIYYKNGWKSYIDGKEVSHKRVNYVLRGMEIPSGKHTITFKFEPKVIQRGKTMSLICYAFLFLIPVGWFYFEKKKKNV